MALRNQPYLPLYIQDYLTDEKLNECSASAQGIYIKIMCIMHKSDEYGTILLKQKDKQNESTCLNFAIKLARLLPFTTEEINSALEELVNEKVLTIEGDKMYQKRMVKDNEVSEKRAIAGKKGGKATQFAKAKYKANSEYESEYEYEDVEYPFTSEKFKIKWDEWIKYKKEQFGFKYKSKISKQAALNKIKSLSRSETDAIKIIDQSIENGWKGFFKLEKGKSTEMIPSEGFVL